MPVNADHSLEWLQMLYGRIEEGWVNLFSVEKGNGRRHVEWAPVDNLKALGPTIESLGEKGDVWFGVATRADRLEDGQRGGINSCETIPAFWLDIDIAGPAHRLPGLPTNHTQAVDLVKRFPLQPSAVVQSGYGMQPWWRLKEPLSAAEAIPLLTQWQLTWERLASDMGIHVDNVSNIDRVMRLPGTLNWKLDRGVPVTYRASWNRDYGAEEIEDHLEPLPTAEEVEQRYTSARHLAGSRFNEAVPATEVLKSLSWVFVRQDPRTKDSHWRHPMATNEVSATVYGDDGHCAVWSDTVNAATGIPLRKPMDSFGLYTWLYHYGNFKAARADLLERGFKEAGDNKKLRIDKINFKPVGTSRLVTRLVSEVNGTYPEWLWHGWLPRGKLVVLEGDPATGKSTVSLDLAARLTTGRDMPDGTPGVDSSYVLFLSAEDDLDDTTVWRLQAAQADLSRVIHVDAVISEETDETSPLIIPLDVAPLWKKVEETRASMVIIDVLAAYLGGEVDSHKDASVRRALRPLVEMAQATKTTVFLLRHLRKERTGKAMYQGNGSIGIAGVARAVHTIGYHPDNEAIRVLAPVKVNTAARPKALSFRLLKHDDLPCAYVEWGDEVDMNADELLNAEQVQPDTLLGTCCQAMRDMLPPGKEMLSNEFMSSLKELGFTKGTIDRARAKENIQAHQIEFKTGDVRYGWVVFRHPFAQK